MVTEAWTYETAAAAWRRTRSNPEPVWADFEAAERRLLDHAPRTAGEAAQILAVIVDQGGDRRSDGRDVEAVARVRRFLLQLARLETADGALRNVA